MKLYRIIAKQSIFSEAYIEAENEAEAKRLAYDPEYTMEFKPLSEIDWSIDSIEFQTEAKFSSEGV